MRTQDQVTAEFTGYVLMAVKIAFGFPEPKILLGVLIPNG
jgi:hypothetical protein